MLLSSRITGLGCLLVLALLRNTVAVAAEPEGNPAEPIRKIYLIGNSLTWDTVPARLDGDVQWHVDCGKSLPWIHEHPEKPCVKTSRLWPETLAKKQYEIIVLQTHYGATLSEDVEVINDWLKMQPAAVCVIHTGWAHHEQRATEYAGQQTDGPMQHSPAYIMALLRTLRKQHPARTFRQTHAIDLLAKVASDIEKNVAPLSSVSDLHRDKIHMDVVTGRYLMHNAMRHALGQPLSIKGFEKIDPAMKTYLDSVLATLPPVKANR